MAINSLAMAINFLLFWRDRDRWDKPNKTAG